MLPGSWLFPLWSSMTMLTPGSSRCGLRSARRMKCWLRRLTGSLCCDPASGRPDPDDRDADARRRGSAATAALHRDGRLLRLDEGREDAGPELCAQVHAAAPGRLGTRPASGSAAHQDPGVRVDPEVVRG